MLFVVGAAAYLLTMSRAPYTGHFVVKAIPILALAAYVLLQQQGIGGSLIALGLLFSAGGDVALALDRKKYFVVGLGLFLVGHLFYVAGLTQAVTAFRLTVPVLLLVGYAAALGIWLFPALGKLRGPVLLYMVVITLMGIAAALHPQPFPILLPGAVLFMLSDSFIAIDKFRHPLPYAHYLIMITYYLGQLGIALGSTR